MRRVLIVLMLLAALAPACPADSTDWDLSVSDSAPYVGDAVVFTVRTVFPVYRDYVLLEVRDPLGVVVQTDVLQLDGYGRANVTWETPLNSDPGLYEVSAYFKNSKVDNLTVELVFDEADYQAKVIRLLEERIERQEAYNRQTRQVANAAFNRADYFIQRWGLLTMVLDILVIFLLFRVGIDAYVRAFRFEDPASGFLRFWRRAFAPQTDGNLTMVLGHEDMVHTIPDHARGIYCGKCHVWVAEGEKHEHAPPSPPPAPPSTPPARPPAGRVEPVRKVVPMRRVVKRRVIAHPPTENRSQEKVMQ